MTYLGSKVWRNPRIETCEKDIPTLGPDEVLLEVKACGICGSDVHMLQSDDDEYIFYPELTVFPSTLEHEFSGVIFEAGENTINKATDKRFVKGKVVYAEKIIGCLMCKPCATGTMVPIILISEK